MPGILRMLLAALALAVVPAASAADAPAGSLPAATRALDLPENWLRPLPPFRVLGNLYYVGSEGISIWFLPTPQGHVVIDGGLPQNAAMAAAGIRTLGYRPEDIRILLNTHAHFDHSGGLAELKRLSGARLVASAGDRSALEGGFYLGSEDDHAFDAPPVAVDGTVADGESVELGGVRLTAHLTPGHTRGCTSWTLSLEEGGRRYEALVFCSASVAANRLVAPPQYAGIVEDYRRTFAITRGWTPDVFLANHAEFFGLHQKRARLLAGDALAFVDRAEFPRFIAEQAADFEAALESQRNAAADRR